MFRKRFVVRTKVGKSHKQRRQLYDEHADMLTPADCRVQTELERIAGECFDHQHVQIQACRRVDGISGNSGNECVCGVVISVAYKCANKIIALMRGCYVEHQLLVCVCVLCCVVFVFRVCELPSTSIQKKFVRHE